MTTNLEWLFENDYETLCDQMGGQPCSCCVVGCEHDLGSDEACSNALREWLLAEHETNGTDDETNGIHADAPLVDRDPVEIMRECGGMEHSMGSMRKALGIECVAGWQMRCLRKLADMVERDYVKLSEYERATRDAQELYLQVCRDLIEYDKALDAVKNERDEWKAKAEQAERAMNAAAGKWARADIRSAKRAEVLERVEKLRGSNCDGYVLLDAMFGEVPNDGTWEIDSDIDKLIDLLNDEPMDTQRDTNGTCPDAMRQSSTHSKTEPRLTEQSESLSDESCGQYADQGEREEAPDCESDSREKLEAELPCYFGEPRDLAMIRGWLDRQAAIATRECTSVYEQGCEACRAAQKRRIAELTKQLEAATHANDDYRDEWHRVCAERMDLRRELTAEKNKAVALGEELGKVMAERDELLVSVDTGKALIELYKKDGIDLYRQIDELAAERDQWRNKCGVMLDASQEIRRLADIE